MLFNILQKAILKLYKGPLIFIFSPPVTVLNKYNYFDNKVLQRQILKTNKKYQSLGRVPVC